MKEIDATKKSLGRVATEAAMTLMGKDSGLYEPQKVTGQEVHILNASKANISNKKKKTKTYQTYSGYPGGQKDIPMEKVIEKKGYEEVFRMAIRGMLPANRLRKERMKMLKVTD